MVRRDKLPFGFGLDAFEPSVMLLVAPEKDLAVETRGIESISHELEIEQVPV